MTNERDYDSIEAMESNGKSWFGGAGEAGAVVLLLAAVGIGFGVREYRFRSAKEERPVEAPEIVRRAEREEVEYVPEAAVVEEVVVNEEAVEGEPVEEAMPIAEAEVQSEAGVEEAVAVEPEPVEDEAKIKERRGREALALIGYDPAADAVWIEVINDPSVSKNARSNLIEDLNEDGFPDKRNPTRDDLPMIEYRIGLIEELRPYAMDKTNADAFDEAHKDLVNMVNRLTRP